jgi:hypothetical protein
MQFRQRLLMGTAMQARGMHDPTYRLAMLNAKSMVIPALQFDIASGTSTTFANYACATQSGHVVPLTPCGPTGTPQNCLKTSGPVLVATPIDNKLNCILSGNTPNDATFMVKVSSPGNPDYRLFSTYVKSTDGAIIYVDRVQFSAPNAKTIYHTLNSEYTSAAAQPGTVNINVVVPTFSTFDWIQWVPFNGWQAFGAIGGTIFFLYIFHSLLMRVVGIFFENPWAVTYRRSSEHQPLVGGGGSSSSYKEIQDHPPSSNQVHQGHSDI